LRIDPSSNGPIKYISKIRELVNKNKMVSSAIRKVKNSNASLADLPDTDFRVLNEAYKYLSEAGRDMTSGVGYASRTAQRICFQFHTGTHHKKKGINQIYINHAFVVSYFF
jgi:hypothetical protein